jgi:hypothetical protein
MKQMIITPAQISTSEIMKFTARHENRNFSYHSTPFQSKYRNRSNTDAFKIGIEAEKEDRDRYEISADKLLKKTKFRKENDGSLDSYGFELISPIYNFSKPDTLLNDLQTDIIQYLLNADAGEKCGNHFHISHTKISPQTILKGIQNYLPLLYAMYKNRIGNRYCQAKDTNVLLQYPDKYSSAYLTGYGTLEFRIFPALLNVKQLQFRLNLIKAIIENMHLSAFSILKDMVNPKSDIFNALIGVYNTKKKFRALLVRYGTFLNYAKNSLNDDIDMEQFVGEKTLNKLNKYFKEAVSIDGEGEDNIITRSAYTMTETELKTTIQMYQGAEVHTTLFDLSANTLNGERYNVSIEGLYTVPRVIRQCEFVVRRSIDEHGQMWVNVWVNAADLESDTFNFIGKLKNLLSHINVMSYPLDLYMAENL